MQGVKKHEFLNFLLSSQDKYCENEPFFQNSSTIEPLIIDIFDQTPQGDPLILFNLLYVNFY